MVLSPQVKELQGQVTRLWTISSEETGKVFVSADRARVTKCKGEDSWRSQWKRYGERLKMGNTVAFGNSRKASAPYVDLHLQSRHCALAALRTNTQKGVWEQSQLRLHLISAEMGKASSGGQPPSAGYGGTHLLTWPVTLRGWLFARNQDPESHRDCHSLPGLQVFTPATLPPRHQL